MWGGAAISDGTADLVRSVCRERTVRVAVDLGTGEGRSLSVLLAAAPSAAVWTVDDAAVFLESARERLRGMGLDLSHATFVHAPLRPYGSGRWYAVEALEAIPCGIDLLMVDGPIGQVGRSPALPHFLPKLSPGAVVLLDDCLRPGERSLFTAWTELLQGRGIRHRSEVIATDRGLGKLELVP